MSLRTLLRKRLHVHIGFAEPSLPTVQASGEEPARGFTASFGIGNLLSVAGLAVTLLGGFGELYGRIVQLDARATAAEADNRALHDSLSKLYGRFNSEVVSRSDVEARFGNVQQNQLQLYSTLLAKGCAQ